jgi:hypothetical protein
VEALTPAQDAKLLKCMANRQGWSWADIAREVGCAWPPWRLLQQHRHLLLERGELQLPGWNPADDAALVHAVSVHGTRNWMVRCCYP